MPKDAIILIQCDGVYYTGPLGRSNFICLFVCFVMTENKYRKGNHYNISFCHTWWLVSSHSLSLFILGM